MPAKAPPVESGVSGRLRALGGQLRLRRRTLGLSSTVTAEAAGVSRTTLHRIEKGAPSVTLGAYANVIAALGLEVRLVVPGAPWEAPTGSALPDTVRLEDFPQLSALAWQRDRSGELTAREALDLYERNWRHLDHDAMTKRERSLLGALIRELGGGRPLV